MNSTRKLWVGLAALLIASFAVLLWVGSEVHRQAPPLPERVVAEDGRVIFTRQDIETGRQVWQSIGGQQLGSIWGHGGYVAPDWGADWLHREAEAILDGWATREAGVPGYKQLDAPTQAAYATRVQALMRPNTYDATTGTITLSNDRADAIGVVGAHYQSLFSADPATGDLREAYAMRNDTVPDAEHRRQLTAFYWWAAWSSVTERPGATISYTANWPADDLVGNTPPPSAFLWTVFSVLFLSTVAIGLFYAAGLMWGEHTHLSMVEYWRWWVVHLWVEGFFEVFAVAVIAFLFTRLGLLQTKTATVAVLFATIVFMAGGVLGTLHHLYFTGTPTAVIALGASFSALEVVPLAYVGFEAYHSWKMGKATPWMQRYRWPIQFFIAVSFWNLVGAGLFGFLINPPLPLYYMQGLNLTPNHGHTALFGVYGMLGIGLMLFCLRGLKPDVVWNEKLLKTSFWSLNIGLAGMSLLTLLPLGILQLSAALEHGYWYARSAEFMQQPIVDMLVWMRVPADTLFSVGALSLVWFVASLWVAPRREPLPVAQPTEA